VKQGTWESVSRGRRYARYEVNAYADVTGSEVLLYHPIRDISAGGMRIETGSREEIGNRLEVLICFPEQEQEVSLAGEVVWADATPSCEVGLSWRFPDEESRQLLARCIEQAALRQISRADE
jgi:Tfp pilus assembly protein PilZ